MKEIPWFQIPISDICASLKAPLQTHLLLGASPSVTPETCATPSHFLLVSWLPCACPDPIRPAHLPHSLGPDPRQHSPELALSVARLKLGLFP